METESPQFTEVEVTDIDFHMAFGESTSITLWPGDSVTHHKDGWLIEKQARNGFVAETIKVYRRHLLWDSQRVRTQRVPVAPTGGPTPRASAADTPSPAGTPAATPAPAPSGG